MDTRGFNLFWSCLALALFGVLDAASNDKLRVYSNDTATARIVNGKITSLEDAPFMVQLKGSKGQFCGGTLISPEHVLTAAHCLEGKNFDPIRDVRVAAGANLRSDRGIWRMIEKVFIHPKRLVSPYKADVAILKLQFPYEEDDDIKVENDFCKQRPPVGDKLKVYGWGVKKSTKPMAKYPPEYMSNELRRMKQTIISDDDCREPLRRLTPKFLKSAHVTNSSQLVYKTNICAYENQTAFCDGDSGGPAFHKGKLCAIVSWNIGCAHRDYPSVYTSIPSVIDFIEEVLDE